MKKNVLLMIIMSSIFFSLFSTEMSLNYLYRYNCQQAPPADHLLTSIYIGDNRAIVAGAPALTMLDLNTLPVQGTQNYVSRLDGYRARNIYQKDEYLFINLNSSNLNQPYGFSVVKITNDTIEDIITISEEGVFYEKMHIDGDYLYAAAHGDGFRIYDISDPEFPTLCGSITEGFIDAFAVVTNEEIAYVADGAGGLKIVDISDKTNPFIIDGEDLSTSTGTAEAIAYKNGNVYMLLGSAGVAFYNNGIITDKQIIETNSFTEDLCWIDDFLVVSSYPSILVFETSDENIPVLVANESLNRRGNNAKLRIGCGISSYGDNRLLVSSWNHLEVFELLPASLSTQTDINCSEQRIRFLPEGETRPVTITNNGQADLIISSIESNRPSFTTNYTGSTLAIGESVTFELNYNGSINQNSGTVLIYSNDIDENPLPIQVYGNTSNLDPGEIATDFTLPTISKDHNTGEYIEDTFTLSDQIGKIVWLNIYGSW